MPEALDEWGFVKIRPTLQVDVAGLPNADKRSEKLRRNVYSIGDVRPSSRHLLPPRDPDAPS